MSPEPDFVDRLRRRYVALAEIRSDDCPSTEQLWESAHETLARGESELVHQHIIECTACAAAWRLARDFVAPDAQRRIDQPRTSLTYWASFAAAAVLAFVVMGVWAWWFPERIVTPHEFRAQEGAWIDSRVPAEIALPRAECVLKWTPGEEGNRYDILVTDENLDLIAEVYRASRAEFRIDEELLQNVKPGATILWRVTVHSPDGDQTRSRTFVSTVE